MTAIELAKILATHIAQGRGQFEISVFQWEHEWQLLTDLAVREGSELIELYSGTAPAKPKTEDDDLLGLDDLDDLI